MMKLLKILLIVIALMSTHQAFAAPGRLTKKNYEKSKVEKAVIIYGVNWGRQWGCAGFENAQLHELKFIRVDSEAKSFEDGIVLKNPAKLTAKNISKPYASIINPGEYAINGFDVKIAKSLTEIGHFIGSSKNLFEDGKSIGGTFNVSAGEIVYVGDFGLDCAYEPIPWRYYIEKEDFERYVDQFKKEYSGSIWAIFI